MAELLKQHSDLLVLKIGLVLTGPQPSVYCRLEAHVKGKARLLNQWHCSTEDMNLPEQLDSRQTRYRGYTFHCPDEIIHGLQQVLSHTHLDEGVLWLQLVTPYGYLDLVPWEQILQPKLKRPILRLPEFLVFPSERVAATLNVILCASTPVAKSAFAIDDYLPQLAKGLLAVLPQQLRLHVFVDQPIFPRLQSLWQNQALLGQSIYLYDPAAAESYAAPNQDLRISDHGRMLQNPWLLWIRDMLQGQRIDVAHFVAHGYLARDLGALALAESPLQNQDRRMARFIGAHELNLFLTQLGAYSAVFSSPEGNYSEMGLRLLADTLAHLRPGSVLHQELRLDPLSEQIVAAYRFLYGQIDASAPASPALLMYCHPPRLAMPQPRRSSKKDLYDGQDNVPTWVAASERFFDQAQLEAQKMKMTETITRSASTQANTAKQDTLRQLQHIIASVARSGKARGKP